MRSVIGAVARKEFTELIRDGRFRWAVAIIFALLLLSLVTGWQRHARIKAHRESVRRAERERWLAQRETVPHLAAHYGLFVFKPARPLSVVDTGVEPYVGEAVFLEAHQQHLFRHKPAEDSTSVRRFGELTAAVTLQLLLPLLIVLLGYPMFVVEREQGTLRQLLSHAVSRRDLALGKALGLFGPLAVALCAATVIGLTAIRLHSPPGEWWQDFSRVTLLALGYLLYFGVFSGVTFIASALANSSRQALTLLLTFWFANCLMAPQVMTDIARRLYPTPGPLEFAAAMEDDKAKVMKWYDRVAQVEQRLLKLHRVGSAKELPVSPKGVALQEEEEETNAIADKHVTGLYETHERQNRFYQAGGVIAPMLALQSLSMGLAGTDFTHHRDYADAAEAYRRMLVRTMNEDDAAHSDPSAAPYLEDYKAGRALWEKVPPFKYTPPDLKWVLNKQWLSMTLLALWFVVVLVMASRIASRLKV
jgi:ABC-2 type transport system permease protein